MVTILLQQILDLLKGWVSSFTQFATDVMTKLNLIEEDTDNLSDIKSNTDDIKDNTGAVVTPIQSIQSTNATIASDTTAIKNTVSGMSNQLTTISTNVGTASAFAEDCANNTLDIKDKVTTIASDTTQIRSNTNTVVTDLDKVYEALKWALVNIETTETVEGTDSVSFDTDLDNDLVSLEVGIEATQTGSGAPSPTNVRPITGITDKSITVNGNNVTIALGQTVFGGILDVINGVLIIDHTETDLSSLTWSYYTSGSNPLFQANLSTIKINTDYVLPDLLSSTYTVRYSNDRIAFANSANNYDMTLQINATRLLVRDDRYTDANTFKNNVSGYKIVYALASPITVQLTPSQIATIKGINTIITDGNISVTYEESVKHYLDKQEE